MLDIFFNTIRKLLVASIALVFAFVVVYTPQEYSLITPVPTTEAFTGVVTDPGNTAVSTIDAAADIALKIKELVLDPIVYALIQQIKNQIVADLVTWINSGFKGSPGFIQDLDNFLLRAADRAVGTYIQSLGEIGSFLCSPFKLDIQIALAIEYDNIRARRPYQGCTLTGVVEKLEDFIDGNFTQGGWESWIAITAEPNKYTPYGQLLEAKQGLRDRIAETKNNEKLKSSWTGGFLSTEICELIEGSGDPLPVAVDADGDGKVDDTRLETKPIGDIDVGPLPDLSAPQEGDVIPDRQGLAPSSQSIIPGEFLVQKTLTDARPLVQGTTLSKREKCVISTPGKVISEQLSKALGIGVDSLIAADEIQEIVGALLAQLANQAVMGVNGLLGLGGGGYTNSGGYSSGSYLGDLRQSGSNEASADGLRFMQDTLTVQEDILALANIRRPQVEAFLLTPNLEADRRRVAELALEEIVKVQQNAPGYQQSIFTLVNQYQRLEVEYLAAATTQARKTAIQQEQLAILTQFNRQNTDYYSEGELKGAEFNWDTRNF